MKKRPIAQYFKEIEKILKAQYKLSTSSNPSDKGENREDLLLGILNNHLPAVAKAYRGGVIHNPYDEVTKQIDIVVYSSFSPALNQHKKATFLSEGVFAAIEVKSLLTRQNLKQILDCSSNIKRMEKILGMECDFVRFGNTHDSICTGVFAYETQFKSAKQMFDFILKYCDENKISNRNTIDFICILDQYCIKRFRNEDAMSSEGKVDERILLFSNENAFATMLETILEFVTYIGATRFGVYLNAFVKGDKHVGF